MKKILIGTVITIAVLILFAPQKPTDSTSISLGTYTARELRRGVKDGSLADRIVEAIEATTPDLNTIVINDGNSPLQKVSYEQCGFYQKVVFKNGNATTTIDKVTFEPLSARDK